MSFIWADWPAPSCVKAVSTTRMGGVSNPPYNHLNLGDHVGDTVDAVSENRQHLLRSLSVNHIQWLSQVHGVQVVNAQSDQAVLEADASYTSQSQLACAIMTADCLPVLFTNKQGTQVAAAHAGWRGLADGILEATLAQFTNPLDVIVWLGPAIGPDAFEVGQEVYDRFVSDVASASSAFKPSPSHRDRWLADLYQLARLRLMRASVIDIYGGGFCTFSETDRFFSYRRTPVTGRMASLIWIDQP